MSRSQGKILLTLMVENALCTNGINNTLYDMNK